MVLLMAISVVNYKINDWISQKNASNLQLQKEIIALDKELLIINSLKEIQRKLGINFEKMRINQENNLATVHLLDEIIKTIPPEVYLIKIHKKSDKIYLMGG